jgi:hypothetical protein
MASVTMDTGDLFPWGTVTWRVKIASPTIDTGYFLPWGIVTLGVSWPPCNGYL